MKIEIHTSGGPELTIPFPNAMVFSPTLVSLWLKTGRRYAGRAMPEIPPETVRLACRAIQDYRKTHGPWELVRVETGDGTAVIITV